MAELQKDPTVPIGGWLLYYCLSRGVAEPLYFVFTFHKLLSPIEKVFEVGFALAGFAAVLLIGSRQSEALYAIILDIASRFCFSVTVLVRMLLHPFAHARFQSSPLTIALMIAGIAFAIQAAWFFYFKTSEHVRRVLGRNIGT